MRVNKLARAGLLISMVSIGATGIWHAGKAIQKGRKMPFMNQAAPTAVVPPPVIPLPKGVKAPIMQPLPKALLKDIAKTEKKAFDPKTGFALSIGEDEEAIFGIMSPTQSSQIVDEADAYLGETVAWVPKGKQGDQSKFEAAMRFLRKFRTNLLHGLYKWRAFPLKR